MKLCTILCFDISKSNKWEKCKTAFNKIRYMIKRKMYHGIFGCGFSWNRYI